MVGSQTESSMSPITTDDDGGQRSDGGTHSPEFITLRDVGHLRNLSPIQRLPMSRTREHRTAQLQEQDSSFEMVEQPTSSSESADEADYVQVGVLEFNLIFLSRSTTMFMGRTDEIIP